MGVVSRIVSLWERVAARVDADSGESTDRGADSEEPTQRGGSSDGDSAVAGRSSDDEGDHRIGPRADRVDFDALDSESIGSRADVVYETGLSPEEFLEQLVEAHGGNLRQQAFTDHVDWSESLVSRVLGTMEEEGRVVRVQVGHGNVVYTPDSVPDVLASSTDRDDGEPDRRSVR